MLNIDVINLFNYLTGLQNQQLVTQAPENLSPFGDVPASFAIKAAYNLALLKPQVIVIEAALRGPWDDVINPFAVEEAKLALRHSDLPETTPMGPNFEFPIKDNVAFEADQKALREQHPGLDEALSARRDAQKALQQESPAFVFWKAKIEELPSKVPVQHAIILLPMVETPSFS